MTFVLAFIILSISSLFIFPPTAYSQTILFQDDFNDGNANGWEPIQQYGDGTWNVQNQQYGIHIEQGLSNSVISDDFWDTTWTNIRYEVDLTGVYGVDKNLILKFQDLNNFIEIHHSSDGWIRLEKKINGSSIWMASGYYPLENGQTYHFQIDMRGVNIKVYVDGNLIINSDERYPYFDHWKIGLRAGTGAVRPTEVWYDNVKVSELPAPTSTPEPTPTPIPLPSLNVPDIKQYSDPWGSQIYDNATLWSSNPFISRWGCALTSAVMVLRYHGHNVTPESLNNWLNEQPDGYLRNGLVNWLAISRYSLQNSSPSIPALEYRRLPGTTENLIEELTNNRPAILSEPGHFIVAKSQTLDSFGINDPAYESRTLLSSYSNTFGNIGSYRPTHTDLSYILVTVPNNATIDVNDPDGNPIEGYLYTENPITDPISGDGSGNTLKTFMFPTPETGEYSVLVTGEGSYLLNSYLYDQEGNVNTYSKNGILSVGEVDQFVITIGADNSTQADITIADIIRDVDTAYLNGEIKMKFFYNLLKRRFALVDWAMDRNKKMVTQMLRSIYLELRVARPTFISYEAKAALLEDISTLIRQLN